MIDSVKEKGKYELDGNSPFERLVWGKLGWYVQQILKLEIGRLLNLGDYLLLDSDIIWFKETKMIAGYNETTGVTSYFYGSSRQVHPPYHATIHRISGIYYIFISY